jgi:uncharacterized membrane protein YedE/YeeE
MNETQARIAVALFAGLLFGFGLCLSGMLDPARVVGFLDIASGHWDPSLAFVLWGAVVVTGAGVFLQRTMARPILDSAFELEAVDSPVDARLIIGSAIFGSGWGLAGFCPGPAVAALSTSLPEALIFVAAMAVGMMAHDRGRVGLLRA